MKTYKNLPLQNPVVSSVMRKIDSARCLNLLQGARYRPLVTFKRSGRKESRAASAARLFLDPLCCYPHINDCIVLLAVCF